MARLAKRPYKLLYGDTDDITGDTEGEITIANLDLPTIICFVLGCDMSNFATGLVRYTDNCHIFSKENIAQYNEMHELVHAERLAVMKLKIDGCKTARSKFQAIEPNWKVPFVTKKRTPAKSQLLLSITCMR